MMHVYRIQYTVFSMIELLLCIDVRAGLGFIYTIY